MIVVSAGLQKSGSGLLFNLTNDLLMENGEEDIRFLKKKYKLENILRYHNCNIGKLSNENIKPLVPIHNSGYSFVIKTHSQPSNNIKKLIDEGVVKVTCIIRDPRDVLISAMDHGKRILEKGECHTFASCTSIEKTIPQVITWLENSILKWINLKNKNVMVIKYEDLILNPIKELSKIASFLNIVLKKNDFSAINSKYSAEKLNDFQKDYLHFNIGKAERYKGTYNKEDLDRCNNAFLPYLIKMGYDNTI